MLTVTALIALHAPTDGKQPLTGDVPGICYICGLGTDRGQRRPPSDVFTAWASCTQGDVLCPDCAATLNYRDVRMFSWLVTPDAFRVSGRGDRGWLWDAIQDPPEPPYALYITRGGQKQGWISGVRQIAMSRATIPVLTDWTDRPVILRRVDWETMSPLVMRLREAGLSKRALIQGEYTANQWKRAIADGYVAELRRAQGYAGDPRWEILCHVSNDPTGPNGDPAGGSGADPAPGPRLPLG